MLQLLSRSSLLLLCALFFNVPSYAAPKCERMVATGNPEYPPYLWRNPQNPQQLIGANADLLKHIAQQIGVDVDIIYSGPWSRAQDEVRTGRIDLIAGAFITHDRLAQMDYVYPALYQTSSVVWVRKEARFPYSSIEDLQGRSGLTLVHNSFGQKFDVYAKENLQLEEVPSLIQALQMLLLGRADYVLYERMPGAALAQQNGLIENLELLEPPISSEGLHLTLSHNSACNDAWLRGQLAQKMTELSGSELAAQLLQSNIERWNKQLATEITTQD